MIVYDGASRIDRTPIVGIVTGLVGCPSGNMKTGPMLQLWILARDVHPYAAIQTGEDKGICGACSHRPTLFKAAGVRRCYVGVHEAPTSVWRTYQRGVYLPFDIAGRRELPIRLGAYGDPGALPPSAITRALALSSGRSTGYTHRWRQRPDLRSTCMASTDNPAETEIARANGWRTYAIADTDPGAVMCPASKEAGRRTVCFACLLCSGSGTAKSVFIPAH